MMLNNSARSPFSFLFTALLMLFFGCSIVGTQGKGDVEPPLVADQSESYHLQSGDEIDLQVYREPQLSGTFRVDESGRIRHPLCGPVSVKEMSIEEAEICIAGVLSESYLVNPRVVISVVSAQSSQVVILGEVVSPGIQPFPFGETITLLQAIAEAGGFTALASMNRVTIVRSVDGREESIRVKVSKLISGQEPDVELMPNDVIMVPQIFF